MKVTVNTKEKQFEPIELNITIENVSDLATIVDMMGRLQDSYTEYKYLKGILEQHTN